MSTRRTILECNTVPVEIFLSRIPYFLAGLTAKQQRHQTTTKYDERTDKQTYIQNHIYKFSLTDVITHVQCQNITFFLRIQLETSLTQIPM